MSDLAALLADPFVAAELDAAVAPYRHCLSASELAWMRTRLAEELLEHGELQRLLAAAYPREVDESGERVKEWLRTTALGMRALGDDALGGGQGGVR